MAGPNIEFLEFVSREQLARLYQNCKALIYPQEEDWGITALEAQCCGKPVIAYAKGGSLEYIVDRETGYFFREQTPEALVNAVVDFERIKFDPDIVRKNAMQYDKSIFKERIKKMVNEMYEEYKRERGT